MKDTLRCPFAQPSPSRGGGGGNASSGLGGQWTGTAGWWLAPRSWALQLAPPLKPTSLPQPQPASVPVLHPAPSCLPSLSLFPPLNRLQQQDGTNLWLNSPKITRDLSKAVCVKLTGACTLLSNALRSEESPGTPPRHSPPVPGLTVLLGPTSPAPPGLATDPTRGVPEERGTAPCPSTWQRGQEEGSGLPVHHHPHRSCSQSGSIMCQPVLLQLVHVSSWPSGEEAKRSMEMRPRAWQRLCCHQAQSALGPDDATGPQIPPPTWNKLSLASESLGGREEVAERKSLLLSRGEKEATPAQL